MYPTKKGSRKGGSWVWVRWKLEGSLIQPPPLTKTVLINSQPRKSLRDGISSCKTKVLWNREIEIVHANYRQLTMVTNMRGNMAAPNDHTDKPRL